MIAFFRDVFADQFSASSPLGASLLPGNEHAALRVAQAIYEKRDFDRLPILPDVLEDAACADAAIRGHCRGPGRTCAAAGWWI
jgi:hypothetical protein